MNANYTIKLHRLGHFVIRELECFVAFFYAWCFYGSVRHGRPVVPAIRNLTYHSCPAKRLITGYGGPGRAFSKWFLARFEITQSGYVKVSFCPTVILVH